MSICKAQDFKDWLKSICDNWDVIFQELNIGDEPQLRICFGECFPMWIRIDIDLKKQAATLVGVVHIDHVPHERTDYHEIISLIWASVMRGSNTASVRLVDIPHPVIPGVLWGRYVIFDKQPQASFIDLNCPDYPLIERVLLFSTLAAWDFSLFYQTSSGNPGIERCIEDLNWEVEAAKLFGVKPGHRAAVHNIRRNPNWQFYSRLDLGLSLIITENDVAHRLCPRNFLENKRETAGPEGQLLQTGELLNAIPSKDIPKYKKILKAIAAKMKIPKHQFNEESCLMLPTESHLIIILPTAILSLSGEYGHRQYIGQLSGLRIRHQDEAALLHSKVTFKWQAKIDDEKFEALILDLLNREPGVNWVRQVGASRASDNQRDLIAEWEAAPAEWEKVNEKSAFVRRQTIVQCKALCKSVNRNDVGDVPGTVEIHDANSYLLVAYPRVTPQLIDYLTKVPRKRGIFADWWTQSEIEDRLRRNLDVAHRYPTLFEIIEALPCAD